MKRLILANIILLLAINIIPKPTNTGIKIAVTEQVIEEVIEEQQITSRSMDETRTLQEEKIITYSNELIEYIKGKESFSPTAYKLDGEEWYTIGYGTHNAEIKSTDTITEEKAYELLILELNADVEFVIKYMSYLEEDLTQGQIDALTDFVYNGGLGMLQKLTANKTRSLDEIAKHITAYTHSGKKVLKGLEIRRNDELKMFKGEFYNEEII